MEEIKEGYTNWFSTTPIQQFCQCPREFLYCTLQSELCSASPHFLPVDLFSESKSQKLIEVGRDLHEPCSPKPIKAGTESQMRMLRVQSELAEIPVSLGNMFNGLTMITMTNFFLKPHHNSLCYCLSPLFLVLSLPLWEVSVPVFSKKSPYTSGRLHLVPSQPSPG